MNMPSWNALIFLKCMEKMYLGNCDKAFYEKQFRDVCASITTYPELEPLTMKDFECWESIERAYVDEYMTELDQLFCPVCRTFYSDPCEHIAYIWQKRYPNPQD
jgi:hypothetical protein